VHLVNFKKCLHFAQHFSTKEKSLNGGAEERKAFHQFGKQAFHQFGKQSTAFCIEERFSHEAEGKIEAQIGSKTRCFQICFEMTSQVTKTIELKTW
jgi:hypothetical protein